MKLASIDIGSNTLRLLVAGAVPGAGLRPLLYRRAVTRLGGGFSETRGIAPVAAERTISALEGFVREARGLGAESIRAVATSAVRRAANRESFIEEIRKRTGLDVRVISGDEEAALTLKGVLSEIKLPRERLLVMDVGGGSTEYIASTGRRAEGQWSLEMGVVRLAEGFLRGDPPERESLAAIEGAILDFLKDLKKLMERDGVSPELYSCLSGAAFVGTAGTVTTLAAIDLEMEEYRREAVNGHVLSKDRVAGLYKDLSGLTLGERKKIKGLEPGREDLIIPGAAITLLTMDAFGFDRMTVSDSGLLEGILIEALERAGTVIEKQEA